MQSRWNDFEAQAFAAKAGELPELGLRVYTSRLLGSEPALVLHGGGNTSLKYQSLAGSDGQLLFVKGSGSDLATVNAEDFAVVRTRALCELIDSGSLDNEALARAVALAMERPGPKPSIETLLHAVLPWRYVEHTHADSILAVTNTDNGEAIARGLFGELAPLVPFRHSGLALAQAAHDAYRRSATKHTIGLILLHHGVFAFGDTARQSYENMLRLVTRAEDFLKRRGAWALPEDHRPFEVPDPVRIARLRAGLSRLAGFPLLLGRLDGPQWQAYARRSDLVELASQGPATPQHAVFIKREPLLGTDADAYARQYEEYVRTATRGRCAAECGLDPAPRVVMDAHLGVWAASANQHYLEMTKDILRQDMEIKTRAAAHDRYRGLPGAAILEAEIHYGGFERRLHASGGPAANFLGEIVLLCGEADALRVLRTAFEAQGAMVVEPVQLGGPDCGADQAALQLTLRYGGVDVVVTDGPSPGWIEQLLEVLACAPRGGRVLVLSKGLDGGDALARACAAAGVTCTFVPGGAPRTMAEAERVVARCQRRGATCPAPTSDAGAMH